MKASTIIKVLLIVGFVAIGAVGWVNSLNPYVTVAQAKTSPDTVQVKGALLVDTISFGKDGALNFDIQDDTGRLKIVYKLSKPGNLEQASHVVAVGKYQGTAFQAERLLIKCPSKYQGATSGSK
jgi:cytochrome c-type biogenesis protein CcmE